MIKDQIGGEIWREVRVISLCCVVINTLLISTNMATDLYRVLDLVVFASLYTRQELENMRGKHLVYLKHFNEGLFCGAMH